MPGMALAFSVVMAFLAPRYPGWFGSGLPPFTQRFLAIHLLWIAISTAALTAAAIGAQMPRWPGGMPHGVRSTSCCAWRRY
jgi:hypothetical protein